MRQTPPLDALHPSTLVLGRMRLSFSVATPSSSVPPYDMLVPHPGPYKYDAYFSCTEKSSEVSSSSQLSSQRCVVCPCAPTSSSFAQSRLLVSPALLHRVFISYLLPGSPRTHHLPPAVLLAFAVGVVSCRLSSPRLWLLWSQVDSLLTSWTVVRTGRGLSEVTSVRWLSRRLS